MSKVLEFFGFTAEEDDYIERFPEYEPPDYCPFCYYFEWPETPLEDRNGQPAKVGDVSSCVACAKAAEWGLEGTLLKWLEKQKARPS